MMFRGCLTCFDLGAGSRESWNSVAVEHKCDVDIKFTRR
jgi:hypothetical protein